MATIARDHRASRAHVGSEVGAYLRHLDYLLIAAVAGVITYGIWVLTAVTRNDVPGDPTYFVSRQEVYIAVGAALAAVTAAISPEIYRRYAKALYALTVTLLLLVLVVGDDVRGSKRWIEFGSFRFQPSEIGKVLLILFLAAFVANRARSDSPWKTVWGAVGLAALPMLLVFKEPDFGSTLIYGSALLAVLFFGGLPWKHLATLAIVTALIALSVLWFLPSAGMEVLDAYQKDRLIGFVHPDVDPSGTTYNVNQSITAVGSGGLDGRGVAGASQTNMNYLPEHNTDFIFSSLAEQRGFLGAAILLMLYAFIAWRGIKIVAIAPSLYTSAVAGAIVFSFLFQIFVNVGMTVGIAPVTGIPLPFVSFGGSSMITTMLMIGLLEAIHVRGRLAGRR
ncbi:MAG TPA: rod shape-determining protein RodA [Gaiellaceae bacterium]|jgi:rod shape determining protein RodA|nr:rod shape-determining protein RodA [Gaiellaceae bacterium]